eukprot:3708641-Rhodomonas_salina.1
MKHQWQHDKMFSVKNLQVSVMCTAGGGFAGYWADMQVFDFDSMEWVDLSTSIEGRAPEGRHGMGFAEAQGKLYIFGGWSLKGEACAK